MPKKQNLISNLIEKIMHPKEAQKAQNMMLIEAIKNGNIRQMQFAIENGANLKYTPTRPEVFGRCENKPLLHTVFNYCSDKDIFDYMVNYLLNHGAETRGVMEYAIDEQNINAVTALSKNGFDISHYFKNIVNVMHDTDYDARTYPLYIRNQNYFIQGLCNKNVFAKIEPEIIKTAIKDLSIANANIKSIELAKRYLRKEADLCIIDSLYNKIKDTPAAEDIILSAASFGDLDTIKMLDEKYNKNSLIESDPTKILNAVINSKENVRESYLQKVINTAIKNGAKYDPNELLTYSVKRGDVDTYNFALGHGADIHKNNDEILLDAIKIEPYSLENTTMLDIICKNNDIIANKGHEALEAIINTRKNLLTNNIPELSSQERESFCDYTLKAFSTLVEAGVPISDTVIKEARKIRDFELIQAADEIAIKEGINKGIPRDEMINNIYSQSWEDLQNDLQNIVENEPETLARQFSHTEKSAVERSDTKESSKDIDPTK